MDELKECPFCGSIVVSVELKNDSYCYVLCNHCYAQGGMGGTRKEAIELWNTRSLNIPKHETVEEWETRTGDSYPDDGPVWDYGREKGKQIYYLCRYVDAGGSWAKVANHHGKPEIEG